jgi:hypothetical protein
MIYFLHLAFNDVLMRYVFSYPQRAKNCLVGLYPADDHKLLSYQDTQLCPDSLCPLGFATAFLMGDVSWQHWVQKCGGHEGMQVTKYHWNCTN